jgi:glycosyltransferase involved in cell wall biosynthesis
MKIAYDPQIFNSQIYGGISRYFCETATRVAKMPDTEVSIIAPMHINAYLDDVPEELVSGFRSPIKHSNVLQRSISRVLGDFMIRRFSPTIIHETYFLPYRLGPSKARRVLTIYDMIHERLMDKNSRGYKITRYKKLAAKRADHVICISESTKRDAIEILGIPTEKISVIYLGFDLMGASCMDLGASSDLNHEPFLLYVGKREGYKNFISLLNAYGTSSLLRSTFKLICFGGGAFDSDELDAIKKLGLNTEQVLHMGGSDQVLAGLYKNAYAFIYPSLYEGFGIPPLEAMAHDCPVICSNTSSIPEVVGDAGEYFNPDDIESIRIAIEQVVKSESHRTMLMAKGRDRLRQFSWDRCASETYNVYKQLASMRG